MENSPRGFIALMTAIIISTVLLLIVTGVSLSGFYGRVNTLDSEFKERSYALADACVSHTLLALANDPANYSTYGSATTTLSSTEACFTGPITKSGVAPNDLYQFETRAYLMKSYTTLSVVAKVTDLSVQSETEFPTYW